MVANTNEVTVWKSKGLSGENIKPPSTSNNSFNLGINYTDSTKIQVKFDGTCLKQEKLMFTHKKLVNMDILYEINLLPFTVGKLTIKLTILINIHILAVVLDLMQVEVFRYQMGVVGLEKTW